MTKSGLHEFLLRGRSNEGFSPLLFSFGKGESRAFVLLNHPSLLSIVVACSLHVHTTRTVTRHRWRSSTERLDQLPLNGKKPSPLSLRSRRDRKDLSTHIATLHPSRPRRRVALAQPTLWLLTPRWNPTGARACPCVSCCEARGMAWLARRRSSMQKIAAKPKRGFRMFEPSTRFDWTSFRPLDGFERKILRLKGHDVPNRTRRDFPNGLAFFEREA